MTSSLLRFDVPLEEQAGVSAAAAADQGDR